MKKYLICLLSVLTLAFTANAQALKYVGCTPESGSLVSSFDKIILHFDLSEIVAEYGDEDNWGIMWNAFYEEAFLDFFPPQCATLFKGDKEDGIVLARDANSLKVTDANWSPGNEVLVSFPNVEVESGVLYTLEITYDFIAKNKNISNANLHLDCTYSPITMQFYGSSETKKVLKYESSSIGESAKLEKLGGEDIRLTFNYGVEVLSGASATVTEDGISGSVVSASNISVDPSDSKSILISFPETTLYNGHQYTLTLPAGAVGVAGETDVVNSEVTVPFEGASFRYFGKGRVSPTSNRPNSPVTLDAVNIPFNFPEIEGSGFIYGFVNGHNEIPMKVYKGTEEYGELIATIKPSDGTNTSVSYNVSAVKVETGQQYTLVIEEGEVKAYAIGDPRNSYLKDYISEKVVLTYWTPTRESLPEFRLSVDNIDGNAPGVSYDHIEAVKFNITSPEYDYQTYSLISVNPTAYLYLVTGEEKQEIKRVIIDNRSANFDVDLYEGKTYRVEIPEGTYSIKDSEFLKRHVIQQELSYTIKGTHPLESDIEFSSNIAEGQKVSHVGVVSFYTESGVTPAENASLEIRRDNQTVATSPLRVVQENGYSHIYADFSDADHRAFATESGISYHAVLPKGTLIDASNTELHNREYSVAFSGLETAATATYHNVTLTIDNAVAQTSEVEEGRTLGYTFTPADEFWKLESVDGAVLQDGEYVTAPVTADTEVKVRFAPAREVDFDFTTAIDGIIEGCSYRIYSDGTHLVIDGVSAGDRIRVYTTGGTLMADKIVPTDMTTARLTLEPGIYIIAR